MSELGVIRGVGVAPEDAVLGSFGGASGAVGATPLLNTKFLKHLGGNWSDSASWSVYSSDGGDNAGAPAATDNVILDSRSGNLTIDATAACRSFDCNSAVGNGSYTGTVTHTATIVLTVGDATAGNANVAFRLVTGMTYTLGAVTASVTFGSTSTTQQAIETAAKSLGTVAMSGVGSSYLLSDNMVTGNTSFGLTAGTLNLNSKNLTTGTFTASAGTTLTLGTGTITVLRTAAGSAFSVSGTTTLSAASGAVVIGSVSSNSRTFAGAGKTYGTLTYTIAGSTGTLVLTGANTFGTINFSDVTNARTLTLPGSATTTITSAFNVNGTSGKLMSVTSSAGSATVSKTSGLVTCSFLSLTNIPSTGGAVFTATSSTDGGGNTGWVITP